MGFSVTGMQAMPITMNILDQSTSVVPAQLKEALAGHNVRRNLPNSNLSNWGNMRTREVVLSTTRPTISLQWSPEDWIILTCRTFPLRTIARINHRSHRSLKIFSTKSGTLASRRKAYANKRHLLKMAESTILARCTRTKVTSRTKNALVSPSLSVLCPIWTIQFYRIPP